MRDRTIAVDLPREFTQGTLALVAQSEGSCMPVSRPWSGSTLRLPPFAVVVLTAR